MTIHLGIWFFQLLAVLVVFITVVVVHVKVKNKYARGVVTGMGVFLFFYGLFELFGRLFELAGLK